MHTPTFGELNPNDLLHNNPQMVTDLPISATFYVFVRPGRKSKSQALQACLPNMAALDLDLITCHSRALHQSLDAQRFCAWVSTHLLNVRRGVVKSWHNDSLPRPPSVPNLAPYVAFLIRPAKIYAQNERFICIFVWSDIDRIHCEHVVSRPSDSWTLR